MRILAAAIRKTYWRGFAEVDTAGFQSPFLCSTLRENEVWLFNISQISSHNLAVNRSQAWKQSKDHKSVG